MAKTEVRAFEANAVLIPASAVEPARPNRRPSVDPEMCTLLMLDGDRESGLLFTKEQVSPNAVASFALEGDTYYRIVNDGLTVKREPFCRAGLSITEQESVPYPRIQLLPDMWVLKIDETRHWNGLKDHKIRRVFGVYVLNKRAAHHLCEITPSYELHMFDSQYEQGWLPDDPNYESLNEAAQEHVRGGDWQQDSDVIYMHAPDVEKMLKTRIRERMGDLPDGAAGGYKLTGLLSVTEEDAIEEIRDRLLPNGDL